MDRVDGWVAAKALDWADDYLAAALADPSTVCAKMWMSKSTASAKPCAIRACGTSGSKQASASLRIPARCSKAWRGCGQSLQTWTAADVQQADSLWLVQLNKLLDHMLAQAAQYPQFMRRADVRLSLMVRDGVMRYKEQAARIRVRQGERLGQPRNGGKTRIERGPRFAVYPHQRHTGGRLGGAW